MNILVLMAGSDKAFHEAGYSYPKNLIEIAGIPMVQHVIEQLRSLAHPSSKLYAIVRREENAMHYTGAVIRLLSPEALIVETVGNTLGAACTALLAIEHINNDNPLLICNGDIIIDGNLQEIITSFRSSNLDGGIVVFEAIHPRWSYVKCDEDGQVIEAAEKRPISNLATAGVYYFKHGKQFVSAAMEMIRKDDSVEGRYFICPVYNQLILQQARIGIRKISRNIYFSLATPQGLALYEGHLQSKQKTNQ